MTAKTTSLISALGIPLLGLGALLTSLQQPRPLRPPPASEAEMMLLLEPDPRVDGVMAAVLRQEARRVARSRAAHPGGAAEAIAGYNLVARECTPAVFERTGLPQSMGPRPPR